MELDPFISRKIVALEKLTMRVRVLLINGFLSPRRIIFVTHLLAHLLPVPLCVSDFFGSMRMYIPVREISTDDLPTWANSAVFFLLP